MPTWTQRALLVSILASLAVAGRPPVAHAEESPAAKREIARPKKGKVATAPPAGATLVADKQLPKGLKWKADAETKSVFAVTPGAGEQREIWFIDPDTGWAYTIDGPGNVFVANPITGQIYRRGTLASWVGDLLYFFSFWDPEISGKSRSFALPKADRFFAIYQDPRVQSYDASAAYEEVWTYEQYFESTQFVETYESYVEEYDQEVATSPAEPAVDGDDGPSAGEAVGETEQEAEPADDEASAAGEADDPAAEEADDASSDDAEAASDDGGADDEPAGGADAGAEGTEQDE